LKISFTDYRGIESSRDVLDNITSHQVC